MRQERKASDSSKRTASDVFNEAKRRFQYKPGPSRKPYVHDILGKSMRGQIKDSREKSMETKCTQHHSQIKKSKEYSNKENTAKDIEGIKNTNIQLVKKMMKDIMKENKQRDAQQVIQKCEKIKELQQLVNTEQQQQSRKKSKKSEKNEKVEEQKLRFSIQLKRPHVQIRNYYPSNSKLFPKKKEFKSTKESRNTTLELKSPAQNRSQFLFQKQNQPLKPISTSINRPSQDHNRHLSSIQILQISQPPAQPPSESPLSFNFGDLDIQVQSVKEPEQSDDLFKNYSSSKNSTKSKKYKYDMEQQNKSQSQSIMSLSPVKGYSFDREERHDIEDKKRKLSVQLTKGVKQTIIEQEEDKTSYSRILDNKCNQIFEILDNKHIGIINFRNYQNHSLHPEIKSLISPIVSKVQKESKSFNRKQFLLEVKRIMLSMKQEQIQSLAKCPILKTKTQQARKSSKSTRARLDAQKTLPLKQISRSPYMRLNTRNSIGEIELSKLSNPDSSLQISSQSINQQSYHPQQFISDRKKEDDKPIERSHPLYSLRRSLESQLDASRIDALNQRLSSYIQRNNIQQNRFTSNQINLEFHELKKHLGFS